MALQLIIGNKNYSSWSMRPWVLMKELGIPFLEKKLRFDFSENSAYRQEVARYSSSGLVPVLMDEGLAVWDSLAIAEYLHEQHPEAGVRANVARIEAAWGDALQSHGGPFLFGAYSAADAMFAPVCMRFITYALPLSETARGYVQRMAASAGVMAWVADARAEEDFLDFEEPYRPQRGP